MTQSQRTSTTPLEALLVTGMAFGLFIVSSVQAVSANFASAAFSDNSLLWIAGVELMLSAAAVTFLYLRGFAVATLMPAPTFKGTIVGIGLFFAAWLIGQIVVAPFVGVADHDVHLLQLGERGFLGRGRHPAILANTVAHRELQIGD